MKTIDLIKEKMPVPEEAKALRKEFAGRKKQVLGALKEGPRSVPQIAEATGLPREVVMYTLMTLRKYGDVETGEVDDMDEYFLYQSVKKKNQNG